MGHRVTTLNVNTIEPAGSTLTLGASGDTIVATDSVNVNTVKDAGGNTLWVSNGSGTLSSVSSGFGDALNLISSQTVTDQASVSFTSGISSTYKEYIFKFYNINPATDQAVFSWQSNAVGGSGFSETITSSAFLAANNEAGTDASLGYNTGMDEAQATTFQSLTRTNGNEADQCCAGELHLFNPSSTTYVKQFYSRVNQSHHLDFTQDCFVGGYINTTSAIDEVQFKMDSGNFDGTIMMYGVA